MIQLAISTYSLRRWQQEQSRTLEQVLEQIRALGVAAVEFSGLDEAAGAIGHVPRAEQLRRHCESLGLAVAGYCVGGELLAPPGEQRKTIDRIQRDVDVAAALGARTMRHDVTRGWDASPHAKSISGARTFLTAVKIIAPAVREIAEYAAERSIVTSLENHGFYMQASLRVERFIRAVNHPNFRLTMDMGNFLCVNENPVHAVRRLAKRAVMVHVKDFHVKRKAAAPTFGWFATPTAIALRGAIVGHGAIDIPTQLKLLRRAKYTGYLSLEFEGIEEPVQGIKLGLEYLRDQCAATGIEL